MMKDSFTDFVGSGAEQAAGCAPDRGNSSSLDRLAPFMDKDSRAKGRGFRADTIDFFRILVSADQQSAAGIPKPVGNFRICCRVADGNGNGARPQRCQTCLNPLHGIWQQNADCISRFDPEITEEPRKVAGAFEKFRMTSPRPSGPQMLPCVRVVRLADATAPGCLRSIRF